MKRHCLCSLILLSLTHVATSFPMRAQGTSPVIPEAAAGNPLSSYALSGIDNVNYYNGSVNIHVPVATIAARGSASKTLVVPIQRMWSSTDSSGSGSSYPFTSLAVAANGWPYSLGYLSVESSSHGSLVCTNASNVTEWAPTASGNGNALTWLVWHQPDGTETVLTDVQYDGQAQSIGGTDCGSSYTPADRGNVFRSYDGSGITYVGNSSIYDGPVKNGFDSGGTIYFKDGTRYVVDAFGVPSSMEDRNGNLSTWVFSPTYTGGKYAVTDPAGRVTTFTFTEDLSSQDFDTITWYGTGGALRTITVNYAQLGSSGVTASGAAPQDYSCLFPEFPGSTGSPFDPWVVKSIVLPDSTQYIFQYNVYGEVVKMTLPTGGMVKYAYGGSSCARTADSSLSASAGYGSGAITSGATSIYRPLYERDEYANGGSTATTRLVFTPTAGSPASGQTQVKIQFEDGSGSVKKIEYHDFLGDPTSSAFIPSDPTLYPGWEDGFEFQSAIADPTAATLLTRQIVAGQRSCVSGYDSSTNCSLQTGTDALSSVPPHDPQICQINTTVQGSTSAITSGVTFGYDQYNNQTDMREFDYGAAPSVGTGCPTTLTGFTRETQTTYNTGSAYTTVPSPISGSPPIYAYIADLPSERTVTDASSSTASHEKWHYDETAVASSTQPGHDDTNYGSSATYARGNVTTHIAYDTATSTSSETFAYDQAGSMVSHNDFNNKQTTFGYDSTIHVSPQTVTSPLGSSIGQRSYQYDPNTLKVTSLTDENHSVATYSYVDALDRLTDVQRGAVTKSNTAYVYTGTTEVTTKQDQVSPTDGAIQADTYYDLLGRPIETVQHENSSQSLEGTTAYDALGQLASTTDPLRGGGGPQTSYTYDVLGRPLTVTTADGSATQFLWDVSSTGITAKATDPASNQRKWTIDGLGRLASVTEYPSGGTYTTGYTYNALDNLITVTQDTQTRSFAWNLRGWLTSATNPEATAATTYGYDDNGNLTSRQDACGIKTTYVYDSVNRLTQQSYDVSSESSACTSTTGTASTVNYYYDSGAPNANGRLVTVANSAATDSVLGYDELGRITGSSQTISGGSAMLFSYTYNLADALLTTAYPSGRVVTNEYDPANRINGVTGVLGTSSTTYISGACNVTGSFSGLCYGTNGAPSSLQYGNGVARSYTYNNRQQPTAITDTLSSTTLMSLTNTFGGSTTTNNGNLTQSVIAGSGVSGSGWTQTFGYSDGLNRLNSFSDSGGASQSFTYDRFGNFYQSAQTGLGTSAVPELAWMPTATGSINAAANQLASSTGSVYDNNGNDTTFLGATMSYDAESRQVKVVTSGSTTYTYAYDGLGQRVSKTQGSTVTSYVHDVFGNLATEYNSPALALCNTCYLSWDHLGSTRMVTDGSGNIIARHDYLPFGVELPNGVSGRSGIWAVTDGLSPKFTGQDYDTESFLGFYQARYLAGGVGRFMSPDPGNAGADLTDPQSWNMYGYVRNSPMTFVDPSGLDDCEPFDESGDCSPFDPGSGDSWFPWPGDGGGGGGGGTDPNSCPRGNVCPVAGPQVGPGGSNFQCQTSPKGCNPPKTAAPSPPSAWAAAWDFLWSYIPGAALNNADAEYTADFNPHTMYRFFTTRYCGPGGGGGIVSDLDMGCYAHDKCYERAGLSATSNTVKGPLKETQIDAAQGCNQTLYNYTKGLTGTPGVKALQYWLLNGVKLGILYPGTAAHP